ncbi:MAG: methyltransferase domain-containing protein [Erysipelotrichaceae bacterium]|nr:methyltransferase domain-containing protein [Erysipelotrichaceae bacterium]
MAVYKTGELAKKANVTIRTIRYYDSIDLLKPSRIMDNGYRLYDDNDYLKLQKILCLKSLGFELDDIKTMTATDNYTSFNEALHYQLLAIDKKINSLKSLKESISDISRSMDTDKKLDWSKMMNAVEMNNLEADIIEQYKNSTNIDIRIKLHRLYSNNPESWFKWLYKKFRLRKGMKVLEIGCGNGSLWLENNVNDEIDVSLSDISSGMIEDCKSVLGDRYHYYVFDAHNIPFDDESFDVIICNHTLFYLKDIDKALKEIHRVLKRKGIFYSTTYSDIHMKENTDLVKEFNQKINLSSVNLYEKFGMNNGEEILGRHFDNVKMDIYDDYLEVSDPDDLLNYILSCHGNQNEYLKDHLSEFKELIKKKFKNGSFHITKQACLFKAVK